MKALLVGSLLFLSVLSFSQNYKKGDVVYKISIGANQINWNSTMELVLREKLKTILIRDSNIPNDPFEYSILKRVSLADSTVSRYHLTSKYGFSGYIIINEPKKEIFLVEDNQTPGYMFILGKEKY